MKTLKKLILLMIVLMSTVACNGKWGPINHNSCSDDLWNISQSSCDVDTSQEEKEQEQPIKPGNPVDPGQGQEGQDQGQDQGDSILDQESPELTEGLSGDERFELVKFRLAEGCALYGGSHKYQNDENNGECRKIGSSSISTNYSTSYPAEYHVINGIVTMTYRARDGVKHRTDKAARYSFALGYNTTFTKEDWTFRRHVSFKAERTRYAGPAFVTRQVDGTPILEEYSIKGRITGRIEYDEAGYVISDTFNTPEGQALHESKFIDLCETDPESFECQ